MIDKRLMKLLRGSGKYVGLTIFWNWMALISNVVTVFAIAGLLEHIYTGTLEQNRLITTCVIMAAGIFSRAVFEKLGSITSFHASVNVKRQLRTSIYYKLLKIGNSYHEKVPTSEVVQMSVEGIEQLEVYYGKYLSQLFYSLLAPVTLFGILRFVNMRAAVVLLVCVPFIPISIVAVQKFAKKLLHKYWGAYTELGDSFLENLQGLTTLKIYQADQQKMDEMDVEAEHFRKVTMKVLTMQLNSVSVMDIIAYGGAAVGIFVAVSQFQAGAVTLTGVIAIILLSSEFFIPLRLLGSFFHIAMNGMAASDKIFSLLAQDERETAVESIDTRNADIRFNKVCFGYSEEKQILDGISVQIAPGSFTALAGESGCGKSTMAALLMGSYSNYTGEILIGGKRLLDISEKSLMGHITLVSHNSYLFKGTVAENLQMGRADATVAEMEAVLKKVNLLEYLQGEDGLQTKLTEQGSNLSGGQRQRLALARALLYDTPVYIFDEATSNIDVESETTIMNVIRQLTGRKTIIVISHRLANITGADQILMIEKGRITEMGRHGELVDKKGAYAKMYSKQMELESYRVESGAVKYA